MFKLNSYNYDHFTHEIMLKYYPKIQLVSLYIIFLSFGTFVKANLISYNSEYEIELGKSDEVRLPGKTYVDSASGQLFIDWINVCDNSWVSNQRMMTRFVNSFGVGTVSEINYSINENSMSSEMDFVLEIKENSELQKRVIGNAKINGNLIVKFPESELPDLNFSNDIIFPHKLLDEITKNIKKKNPGIIVMKVYEGTIPEKFFNISIFFTDEFSKEKNVPNEITNNFRKIRMSYYQDNESTPIFEQTIKLNEQGLASYFKYDYPEYSLVLKLKKVKTVKLDCN